MRTKNNTCQQCGKGFYSTPSRKAKGEAKYCSKACESDARAANREASFWSRVEKTDGCWLWQGKPGTHGYGTISIRNTPHLTHRVSYEIAHGSGSADGFFVLHKCDNRLCVNPDHLFLGDHQANMDDMYAKNRAAVGAKHGMSKLTDEDVREIRRRYATEKISQRELGQEYGVRYSTIGHIVRRQKWTHVE
jgi:hypothetical protein